MGPNLDNLYFQIMKATVDCIGFESLAESIVNFFAKQFDAELCTFWRKRVYDEKEQLELCGMKGNKTIPRYNIPKYSLDCSSNNKGVTAWIAIEKKPCLANSYDELKNDPSKAWFGFHEGKWDKFQFTEGNEFRNLLGLPVIYEESELIGVLKIESARNESGFTIEDLNLAEKLVKFVATIFQAHIHREKHEDQKQFALRSLSSSIVRKDQTVFYQEVVNKTAELLNADICTLWIIDEQEKKLRLGANYGVISINDGYVPEYNIDWEVNDDSDFDGLTPWVLVR